MITHEYPIRNNIVLFQSGPLSQWYGSFKNQFSSFRVLDEDSAPFWAQRNHEFNCCEQFMMSAKAAIMGDYHMVDRILLEKNAKEQKNLGRLISYYEQEKWDYYKEDVVFTANYLKFSQNEDLKEYLLSFPRGILFAEASPWDKIWGIGMAPEDRGSGRVESWKGENLLGEAIRRVHQTLLRQKSL